MVDSAPQLETDDQDEPISCYGCKYFDCDEFTDWESGITEYDVFCYAKDEDGNDLYYDQLNDQFPIRGCGYREEK